MVHLHHFSSVADPGCLSRILVFYPSRISDTGSWIQKQLPYRREGWKPQILQNLKLFYFWTAEEKNLGQISKNIRTFTQKVVTKLSKIWVWDPRSGIRKKPFPDPGSRGQKGTGSRIRIRNIAFFKDKKSKWSHKNSGIKVCFYSFCLMMEGSGSEPLTNGSGSGSRRPRNIWILRILIRNTACY